MTGIGNFMSYKNSRLSSKYETLYLLGRPRWVESLLACISRSQIDSSSVLLGQPLLQPCIRRICNQVSIIYAFRCLFGHCVAILHKVEDFPSRNISRISSRLLVALIVFNRVGLPVVTMRVVGSHRMQQLLFHISCLWCQGVHPTYISSQVLAWGDLYWLFDNWWVIQSGLRLLLALDKVIQQAEGGVLGILRGNSRFLVGDTLGDQGFCIMLDGLLEVVKGLEDTGPGGSGCLIFRKFTFQVFHWSV